MADGEREHLQNETQRLRVLIANERPDRLDSVRRIVEARRAMIERAKGILMATHAIDEQEAFERLRSHSQHNGRKLIDIAEAVVESHRLLARRPHEPSEGTAQARSTSEQGAS